MFSLLVCIFCIDFRLFLLALHCLHFYALFVFRKRKTGSFHFNTSIQVPIRTKFRKNWSEISQKIDYFNEIFRSSISTCFIPQKEVYLALF